MCPGDNAFPLTFEIVNDVLEAELSEVGDSGEGPLGILNDAVCIVQVGSEAGLGRIQQGNDCASVTSHWLLHPVQDPLLLQEKQEENHLRAGVTTTFSSWAACKRKRQF